MERSYSTRVSDFLDEMVENMKSWVLTLKPVPGVTSHDNKVLKWL